MYQCLEALSGLDFAEHKDKVDGAAFGLMLGIVGALLRNLSHRDVLLCQGLVIVLTSLWR